MLTLTRIVHFINPDLKNEEARKFGLLAIIFFFIIGAYWFLRLLKDTIFFTVAFPEVLGWLPKQGKLFQPIAQIGSFVVMFVVVLAYSKLVDKVKKHQLFYVLCSIYAALFTIMAIIILLDEWYGPAFVGRIILATTGWMSYFIVESYGALVVALFWSFTNSINDTDSAKRGFPFLMLVSFIGPICCSSIVLFSEKIGSLWPILILASLLIVSVIPLVQYFMRTIPKEYMIGYKAVTKVEKKERFSKNLFSGIILLLSRPYLLGILVVSTVHQAVSQIVEYQMQSLASESEKWGSPLAFAKFQAIYGVSINVLGFLVTLLGTRFILKHCGIRVSILIYPISFGFVLIGIYSYIMLGSPNSTQLLWAMFSVMIFAKGIGYAVNNPVKEMMYIPTSKDAQFKTKSFIDTVGTRGARAGGASINNVFKSSVYDLMLFGTLFSLGLILFWSLIALYVGKKNTEIVSKGEVVG